MAKTQEALPAVQPAARIVVPVQGTDSEFYPQKWAIELAAALSLHVLGLHVSAPGQGAPKDTFRHLLETGRKWSVHVDTRVLEGTEVLREILDELNARDLVVIGTRRLVGRFHVGSLTRDLIAQAPCPVQVVRIE